MALRATADQVPPAEPHPSDRRRAIGIFLAILLLDIAFAGGHLYTMDDHTNYHVVDSLWNRADVHIRPTEQERHLNTVTGADGRLYSYYGIGGPLVFLPFYAAGRWVGNWHGSVHYLSQAGMSLTNSFVTAWAAALIFLLARKFHRSAAASTFAALVYALATPALVWSKHQSNSVIVGTLLLQAILLMMTDKATWSIVAGMVLGLAMNVRYDAAIGVGLMALVQYASGSLRGRKCPLFAVGTISLAILIPLYNQYRFGFPWKLGYPDLDVQGQFQSSMVDGLYGLILSPNRGILAYAPVLLCLPPAWIRMRRDRCWSALALFLGIPLVYVLFYSRIAAWHGGIGWGPRYLACGLPLLCCGFAFIPAVSRSMKVFAGVLVGISFLIQLWGGLASIDSYHDILVEKGVDPILTASDPSLAPLWGQYHVVKNFNLTRFSADSFRSALPAGGYEMTRSLRNTPDFWPFYAWKAGMSGGAVFGAWMAIFAAGAFFLGRCLKWMNG